MTTYKKQNIVVHWRENIFYKSKTDDCMRKKRQNVS